MDTTVSARMDAGLKSQAEAIFASLGLTHSVAINSFYSQVVLRRGLPFELKLPSNEKILTFQEIRNKVRPLAKRYSIKRVYLFGSYARGDANETSDVDLRVDPGAAKGLAIGGFQYDVQEALGRDVDVALSRSLSPRFLETIADEEVLLYG